MQIHRRMVEDGVIIDWLRWHASKLNSESTNEMKSQLSAYRCLLVVIPLFTEYIWIQAD